MAKLITEPVRVTVEHGKTRSVYTANYGSISGDGSGLTSLSFNHARHIHTTKDEINTMNPTRYDRRYIEAPSATVSAEEQTMIRAAKAQERAALEAARLIEEAQQEAEALINEADHKLNLAILEYAQTGKHCDDAARVLNNAGLLGHEDRTVNVTTSNVEDLYLIDNPAFLKVG